MLSSHGGRAVLLKQKEPHSILHVCSAVVRMQASPIGSRVNNWSTAVGSLLEHGGTFRDIHSGFTVWPNSLTAKKNNVTSHLTL